MPCYHPVRLHRDRKTITVGCGKCIGCLTRRSREWAVRCVHEASLYEANAFVTLTYAPEHLPVGGSLVATEIPSFVRRLRKRIAPSMVRYFACGEYGDGNGRPHYHAILFGVDFPDKVFSFTSGSGEKVYRSDLLSDVWGLGHASTGTVTFESAAYVARYAVKKAARRGAHLESVDASTGEVFPRLPERVWMSLKPGIGQGWLQRYFEDVYPSDEVVLGGRSGPVPRYYDKLASVGRAELVEGLKAARVKRGSKRAADQMFAAVTGVPTLASEEKVKQAQVGLLKREL